VAVVHSRDRGGGAVMTQPLADAPIEARARVLDSVAAVLGVNAAALTDHSSPATVPSWDSLNHLNVAMSIESEFGIALTAEQVMEMGSIAAIYATLRTYGIEI
jgi:acyl carrier protein